jgi:GNAT superfamily N-acetyltransferase
MRIVRAATPRDVPALRAMLQALITEHERRYPDAYPRLEPETAAPHYAAEWERRLGTDSTCGVWLATDRDTRGFLAGEVWSRSVGEPPVSFFVEWVYVVPEHRKSGVSRALFREGLIPFCQRHGIEIVEGRTVPGDTQWTERGWTNTALCIKRDVAALAGDVAEDVKR